MAESKALIEVTGLILGFLCRFIVCASAMGGFVGLLLVTVTGGEQQDRRVSCFAPLTAAAHQEGKVLRLAMLTAAGVFGMVFTLAIGI